MTPLEGILVTSRLMVQTYIHRVLRLLTSSHVIPSVRHVNIHSRGKIILEGNKYPLKHKALIFTQAFSKQVKMLLK